MEAIQYQKKNLSSIVAFESVDTAQMEEFRRACGLLAYRWDTTCAHYQVAHMQLTQLHAILMTHPDAGPVLAKSLDRSPCPLPVNVPLPPLTPTSPSPSPLPASWNSITQDPNLLSARLDGHGRPRGAPVRLGRGSQVGRLPDLLLAPQGACTRSSLLASCQQYYHLRHHGQGGRGGRRGGRPARRDGEPAYRGREGVLEGGQSVLSRFLPLLVAHDNTPRDSSSSRAKIPTKNFGIRTRASRSTGMT